MWAPRPQQRRALTAVSPIYMSQPPGLSFVKGSPPGPLSRLGQAMICCLWLRVICLGCISRRGSKQKGFARRQGHQQPKTVVSVLSLSCPLHQWYLRILWARVSTWQLTNRPRALWLSLSPQPAERPSASALLR